MNYDEEQLEWINFVLQVLEESLLIEATEFLKLHLSDDDLRVLEELNESNEGIFKKPKSHKVKAKLSKETDSEIKNKIPEWDTPYTILGIEEKEYSKEELLTFVEIKIDSIKASKHDKLTKLRKINDVLDAYNDIIHSYQKRK